MSLTCDGLSANRRLFHLHNPSARSRTTVHKVKNPYDQERYMSWLSMFLSNNYNYGRYIYFFVDPSHLLKTVSCCSPYLALYSGACGASIRASLPEL